jgi:hypothetical protein
LIFCENNPGSRTVLSIRISKTASISPIIHV